MLYTNPYPMKKILFFVLATLCIHASTLAQTEPGTLLLGGNGNARMTRNIPQSINIGLHPMLGYFVMHNLAVGARMPLYYNQHYGVNSYGFGLSPFARKYFGAGNTKALAEASVGFSMFMHRNKEQNFRQTDRSLGYSASAGGGHFLNNSIGLELLLNYGGSGLYTTTGTRHHVGGLSLNAGFQVHFGR